MWLHKRHTPIKFLNCLRNQNSIYSRIRSPPSFKKQIPHHTNSYSNFLENPRYRYTHPLAPAMSAPEPTANLLTSRHRRRKDMSMVTQDIRAKAEVCYGDETCREKIISLLTEKGLPSGLITVLEEIEEYRYIKDTGFVSLKHKSKRKDHKFDKVAVCYDNEVTAYFEPNRIRNLTGVKAKEFLIWITLSEIYVSGDIPAALITFKTPAGFSKSFPLSSFTFTDVEEANEVHEAKIGKIKGVKL